MSGIVIQNQQNSIQFYISYTMAMDDITYLDVSTVREMYYGCE